MVLDDETIELHKGVVVYVPRGVKLTGCVPRRLLHGVHDVVRGFRKLEKAS
jgi:quercetin dioxygenase-like cupin family protein